jgi:light-regulated signal transduction histidine kinase (bacteriophytochrome)
VKTGSHLFDLGALVLRSRDMCPNSLLANRACRWFVEARHGRLEVESAPGKGTTFRVLLPVGKS